MAALGVGRVFQRAEVFGGISVTENVLDGFHLVAKRGLARFLLRIFHIRDRHGGQDADDRDDDDHFDESKTALSARGTMNDER